MAIAICSDGCSAGGNCGDLTVCIHRYCFVIGRSPGDLRTVRSAGQGQCTLQACGQSQFSHIQSNALFHRSQTLRTEYKVVSIALHCSGIAPDNALFCIVSIVIRNVDPVTGSTVCMAMVFYNNKFAVANVDTCHIDPSVTIRCADSILGSDKHIAYLEVGRCESLTVSTGIVAVTLAAKVARQKHFRISSILILQRQTSGCIEQLALHIEEAVSANYGSQVNIGCLISLLHNNAGCKCPFRYEGLDCSHFCLGQHTLGDLTGFRRNRGCGGHRTGCGVAVAVYSDGCSAGSNSSNLTGCVYRSNCSVGRSPGGVNGCHSSGGVLGNCQGHITTNLYGSGGLIQAYALDGICCQTLGTEDEVELVSSLHVVLVCPNDGISIAVGVHIVLGAGLGASCRVRFRYQELAVTDVHTGNVDPLLCGAAFRAAHIVCASEDITDLEVFRCEGSCATAIHTTAVAFHQHLVEVSGAGNHIAGSIKQSISDGEPAIGTNCRSQVDIGGCIGILHEGRNRTVLFRHIILQSKHFFCCQSAGNDLTVFCLNGHYTSCGVAVAVCSNGCGASGNSSNLAVGIHSSNCSVGRGPDDAFSRSCYQSLFATDLQGDLGLIQADAFNSTGCQTLGTKDEVVFISTIQCSCIAPVGGHAVGQSYAILVNINGCASSIAAATLSHQELAIAYINTGQISPAAVCTLGSSRSDDITDLQISRYEGTAVGHLGTAGVTGHQHLGVVRFGGAQNSLTQIVEADVGVECVHFNAGYIVSRSNECIPQSSLICSVACDGSHFVSGQYAGSDVTGSQLLGTEDEVVLEGSHQISSFTPEGGHAVGQCHAIFVNIDGGAAFLGAGSLGNQELAVAYIEAGQVSPGAVFALGSSGGNDIANLQISRYEGAACGGHLGTAGVAIDQHLGVVGCGGCQNGLTQIVEADGGIECFHIDTGSFISRIYKGIPHTSLVGGVAGNDRLFFSCQSAVFDVTGIYLYAALCGQAVAGQGDNCFTFANSGDLAVCIYSCNAGVGAFPSDRLHGDGVGNSSIGQGEFIAYAHLSFCLAQSHIQQMLAGQTLGTKHIVVHISAVQIFQACPDGADLGGLAGNILIQTAVGVTAHLADQELAVALVDTDDVLPGIAALIVHKATEDIADLEIFRCECLASGNCRCRILCAAVVAGHQHLMEVGVTGDQQAAVGKQFLTGVVYVQGQVLGHINARITVNIGCKGLQLCLLVGGVICDRILFSRGQLAGSHISIHMGLGLLTTVSQLLGTEHIVVDPFCGHIVAEDHIGGNKGLTGAATGCFGNQELIAALVKGCPVNVVAVLAVGTVILSGGANDVAHLQVGVAEDLTVLNGNVLTAIAIFYQHICKVCIIAGIALLLGNIISVFFIVLKDGRPYLADRHILIHVNTYINVCFLVDPNRELGQQLGTLGVQPVLQIQVGNDFLLFLGQLTGADIPEDHGVDVIKGSGGTQGEVAFVQIELCDLFVDGLCQPANQLFIRVDLLVEPFLYLAAGGNFQLHLGGYHKSAVALVNCAKVCADASSAHQQNIAGIQLIQTGQLVGFLVNRTAIVHQHLVKSVAAFRRCCCQGVQVLIGVDQRICAVAVVLKASLNNACIGVVFKAVGFNVQTNGSIDRIGEAQVNGLALQTIHKLCCQLLQSCDAFFVQQDVAGLENEDIHFVLFGQICSRSFVGRQILIDVGILLGGTQAHEHILTERGVQGDGAAGCAEFALIVHRGKPAVAQIYLDLPGGDFTILVLKTAAEGILDADIDNNIAHFQVIIAQFHDTGLIVVVIRVDPNTAVVAFYQHIPYILIFRCDFVTVIQGVHITGQGAVMVNMQAPGLIVLALGEENVLNFFNGGQLQLYANQFFIDTLCELGILFRIGRDLVAVVAVPCGSAGSKEVLHDHLGVAGKLLATHDGRNGVGGDQTYIAAIVNDAVAGLTGNSNGIAQGHGFAYGNIDVPADHTVFIRSCAVGSTDKLGVFRNGFGNRQVNIALAHIEGISAIGMVGCVIRLVGVIGNGNAVSQQFAGGSRLVEADIDGTVNVHAGVLHTGPGSVGDAVAGSLGGVVVVVCQFGCQLANIQNVIHIQLVVGRIVVAIIDGQQVQRTQNDEPCAIFILVSNGAVDLEIALLIAAGDVSAFNSRIVNCAVRLGLIHEGIHIELAAAAVEDPTLANIKHCVLVAAVTLCNDNVAGAHGFFPVAHKFHSFISGQFVFCSIAILGPFAVLYLRNAGIIPAHNHLAAIAALLCKTEHTDGNSVDAVTQNGVFQRFVVDVEAVVRANRQNQRVCSCVFHIREGGGTPSAAVVLSQGAGYTNCATGSQLHRAVLIVALLQVVVPSHFYQRIFQLLTGSLFPGNIRGFNGFCRSIRVYGICNHCLDSVFLAANSNGFCQFYLGLLISCLCRLRKQGNSQSSNDQQQHCGLCALLTFQEEENACRCSQDSHAGAANDQPVEIRTGRNRICSQLNGIAVYRTGGHNGIGLCGAAADQMQALRHNDFRTNLVQAIFGEVLHR